LLSHRRGTGLAGGTRRSVNRGAGYEVASSRPYRRGDSVRSIDWRASARLSTARQSDDFVVREYFAEDNPRVLVFVDRRPAMGLWEPALPWLHKPEAIAAAGRMIVDSALAAQGLVGYLDLPDPDRARWLPPRHGRSADAIRERELGRAEFTGPVDNIELGFRLLSRFRRDLPPGSFVFVLSDFLAPPPLPAWHTLASLGWDAVPVVIQDPRWEQSFPDVSGFLLPLAEPEGGSLRPVRLTASEAAARRRSNERRLAELLHGFAAVEIDPVLISSDDPVDILASFLDWHDDRHARLRRR
jgi:uncharacterized protein (DUF58 family)